MAWSGRSTVVAEEPADKGQRLRDVSQKRGGMEQARFPAIMKDGVAELVGRLLLNQNGRSLAAGSLSPY